MKVDVTPEPQTRGKALESTAARMAGMLDSAMDAIISVDESQRVVVYNRAAEQIFGSPASVMIGQPLTRLIPQRFHASHAEHVRRFGATGVTSRRMGGSRLVYGRRANGDEFPLEASISHLDTPEGKLFTVILRDVTDRVKAQEELATLASEASAVREQEKTRIARELHDELAQSLTALKMDTIWLRDQLPDAPPEVAQRLAAMLAMLDGSASATRRIAADLRPLLLDDLGLQPAIEWLAQNFTRRTGVVCELDVNEQLELPEPVCHGGISDRSGVAGQCRQACRGEPGRATGCAHRARGQPGRARQRPRIRRCGATQAPVAGSGGCARTRPDAQGHG